jgi:integrase-like protein
VLVFPGPKGGPLRRGNFNRQASWPHAVRVIGAEGLHFHDLRHTGNAWAAGSGVGLRDLMARMGHDSERAAIIYQHEARGADLAIASAIDAHIETAKASQVQHGGGSPEAQLMTANGPLMARRDQQDPSGIESRVQHAR